MGSSRAPHTAFPSRRAKSAKNQGGSVRFIVLAGTYLRRGRSRGNLSGKGEWAVARPRPRADPSGEPVDPDRTELLVRLLSRHQDDLFRYIVALVAHEDDARDVLQETSVAVCRKFPEYDPAKPFLAWAYGFAHLEVLKHRDRDRHRVRPFSLEILERLADERAAAEPVMQVRLQALEVCLGKLSEADRALIRRRYQDRVPAEQAAREAGASRRTLFRNLERIRGLLLECIRRQLGPADGP